MKIYMMKQTQQRRFSRGRHLRALLVLSLLLAAAALAACSSPGSPTPPPAHPQPILTAPGEAATTPPTTANLADLPIAFEQVSTTFDQPLYLTHAGDGSGRLFVVEKPGRIIIVRDGEQVSPPFLDIRDRVASAASERGLLSVAFHPDYAQNGHFFVNYTNLEGHTVVARYQVSADNPDQATPESEEILLLIEQPAANHNGGLVKFGPDGYLYIGMGDGGAAGDPWGNAQNGSALLGKLLRIDVDTSTAETPYGIPPDNPFVGSDTTRHEIWALGLRNPWRYSFDRTTGDLYIADVGQNEYEEVHYQAAGSSSGQNYGWNIVEGESCYLEDSCDTSGLEMPVLVYPHQQGDCSITGGYVYRGSNHPVFAGVYFFADYCSGRIWALHQTAGAWESSLLQDTNMSVSSFGEDEEGELYMTDLWNGKVYRLVSQSIVWLPLIRQARAETRYAARNH
jgi:glucose/arabinose dehydrogenase